LPSSLLGRVWVVAGPEVFLVGIVSFAWAMAFLMKRVAAALSIASWPVCGKSIVGWVRYRTRARGRENRYGRLAGSSASLILSKYCRTLSYGTISVIVLTTQQDMNVRAPQLLDAFSGPDPLSLGRL
jgi:hypothetical protein